MHAQIHRALFLIPLEVHESMYPQLCTQCSQEAGTDANSDRLAYIYAVAVGILEHEGPQTVVLVLNALDDA